MKTYNVVVIALLTALVLVLLVIAYYLGSLKGTNEPLPSSFGEAVGGVVDSVSGTDASTQNDADGGSVTDTVPAAGFTVLVSSLPEAQQSILRTLGYEESITFTPDMVACAEGKLGSARVAEIKAGAAPGPLEAASLMPCF